MTKKFIGVSLGYNTSAALVSEYGIEFAMSEERLNGEKNTKAFPINAIRECINKLDLSPDEPIIIGISSYEVINDRTARYIDTSFISMEKDFEESIYDFMSKYIQDECNVSEEHQIIIRRVEHHEAHMLPAVYMSGYLAKKEPLISVTYDGFGDGVCATIVNHKTGEMLAREYIENSIALVYQYVTGALGFKEHQHEGKITGLAAFGEPKYIDLFETNLIDYDSRELRFIPNYKFNFGVPSVTSNVPHNKNIYGFEGMLKLKDAVYFLVNHLKQNGATDADIAATVQEYTEDLVSNWICDVLDENGIMNHNIVLSGGLFANVKVNFRIKRETGANNLFVLPPMGDEGTAIGSAIKMYLNEYGTFGVGHVGLEHNLAKDELYLGTIKPDPIDPINIDPVKYLIINNIDSGEEEILTSLIAKFLADQRIVCMSRGYSEFGPRALGNHSILYDAGQKETNDSLNKKLSRTEFMPFAPITIDKFAADLFLNCGGLDKTLKYMTIAVPVTEEFASNYHAAYHVDKTARPQVLSKPDNSILYNIIEKYSNLTNKKALINTSFNLHNSPIIFSDQVAYDSFVKADLDVLVLNDKLIVKRGIV